MASEQDAGRGLPLAIGNLPQMSQAMGLVSVGVLLLHVHWDRLVAALGTGDGGGGPADGPGKVVG